MNRSTRKKIDAYLARPYTRFAVPSEDGGFTAGVLEFRGCIAEGDTASEAMVDLEGAMRDWLEECLDSGMAIPEPLQASDFGGRVLLRLSSSLHQRAVLVAEMEGTSLNQLLVTAVASYLGDRKSLSDEETDRLAAVLAQKLQIRMAIGATMFLGADQGSESSRPFVPLALNADPPTGTAPALHGSKNPVAPVVAAARRTRG